MILPSIQKRALFSFILLSILLLGHQVSGQVTTLNAWSNQYHGTSTAAQNVTYAIPAGSNTHRILIVAIASSRTTVGTRTVTLTYGGQALNSVAGDMSLATARQHTQLYYLNETGIDAAANTTLSFTVGNGTTRVTDVFVAVFDGVDQTTPITNSQNYSSVDANTTNPVFGTPLSIGANGHAIEIISSVRVGNVTPSTITYATNWTMTTEQTFGTTDGVRNAVATRSVPVSATTDASSTTFGTATRGSMTALSLNAYIPPNSWYTYQSGNFNDFNTWTLDPSGTTFDNGLNIYPADGDEIHILNGFTVTFNLNNRTLSATEIKNGGILDMATSTSNNLGVITGTGSLKVQNGGTSFPAGTYTDFVSTSGGTIEYYNVGGTLSTTQTTYNRLRITNSTGANIIYILASGMTVNGTFEIIGTGAGTVTWQINDGTATQRTITLNGDLTVGTNGRIRAGTGNPANAHNLSMYANLTTNTGASVKFFDDTNATVSDANYTDGDIYTSAATGRAVNVTFTGTSNQTVTCNAQTDFYRFIVSKGSQLPVVTVNSSASTNFRLFAPANLDDGNTTGISNNALSLVAGTLRLTGTLTIPSLVESGGAGNGGADTYDFFGVPSSAALWLDGSGVSLTVTQNLGSDNDDQRLVVNGILKVSSGTFTSGHSKGLGTTNGGTVIVEGGLMNIWHYRTVASVGGLGVSGVVTYMQTGGRVNIGTDGTNGTGVTTGIMAGASDFYARFSLANVNSVFQMSGGDMHIGSPTAGSDAASEAGGLDIQANDYSVTGGNIYLYIPRGTDTNGGTAGIGNGGVNATTPSNSTTNSKHFSIYSTAPLYNLNIYRVGSDVNAVTLGTTVEASLNGNLVVLNNLTLNSIGTPVMPTILNVNGNNNLTVGGNFIINANTYFRPSTGTGELKFNGSGAQSWTNSGTISTVIPVVVTDKTGTLTLTNTLGQNITALTLTSGTLADNGNTITVTGTLTNNATHSSTTNGSITYNGTNAIGGNNGTFGNLFITTAGTSTIATSGNQTVTGTLRLVNNTTLNIASYSLTVLGNIYSNASPGTAGAITDFTANKRILTSGFHNAGGLTRQGVAGNLLFPLGTGSLYTPNMINVTASTHGTITVRPVSSRHPNATVANESLQYYWRVTSSGYVNITAASHNSYTYTAALLSGGNTNNYRPARFDPNNFTWATRDIPTFNAGATTTIPDFNTGTGWTGVTGSQLDGEYTCGFQTAFGTVTAYYSKGDGNWDAASGVWTNNPDHTTGDIAGPPCNFCPVIIGDGNLIDHKININQIGQACGTLSLNVGSTLDCGTFTGLDFGTNTTGTGTLRVASATFPSGDFINFLGAGGGTVEWYGATKTIPTATTGLTGGMPTTGAGTLSAMAAGTYLNVAASTTSGSGTGALFTVVITNATTIGSITVSQSGTGYISTNTLTFNGSLFGGAGNRVVTLAADDIVTTTLASYSNLVINPTSGATITLPANNPTIYNNLTQGTSPFGTYTGTVLTNGLRTISVGGNMSIEAGTFNFNHTPTNSATTLNITGNIVNNGTFAISATTANNQTNTHTITVSGGITNNGTMNLREFTSATRYNVVNLTFTGANNVNFNGTGTGGTTLNLVTVNKGTSQTSAVTYSTSGALNTTAVAAGWLTLTNGTFDFEYPGPTTPITLSTSSYTIPSTAKLKIGSGTVRITSGSGGANELYLDGTLEVAGTATVYTNTTASNGSDNDIEYASAGTPTIIVSGGSLSVDGAIRRSTSTQTGALVYNQTAGVVTVGGNNPNNTRGIFEIDANTGSSFTLDGTSQLNVYRQNGGTGFASLYINPASTGTVSPTSTITVGLGTVTTNIDFRVNIVPAIGRFTVAGGANAQTIMLYNDLVVGDDLTITSPSILNTTAPNPDANVTIGGDFSSTGFYNNNGSPIANTTTTTFNGTGSHTAALTSNTNFYNLTINKPSGTLTVSGTAPAAPGINNLSILSGTLEVGTSGTPLSNTLKVNRDITINGQQTGTQAVEVFSTTGISNTITSSGGSFTNLTLGGTDAAGRTVTVSGNVDILGVLTFNTNRYLMIGANQLTFGNTASVSGAGTTSFIKTNGVSNDLGVVKTWSSNGTFVYPVGTLSNYTPVSYALNVTQAGTLTVIPVNSSHLTYNQGSLEQILEYYWTVRRGNTLLATASGNPYATFTYSAGMFDGSGGTLVAAYLDPTSNPLGWSHSPANGGSANSTTMTFNSTPSTNLPPLGSYYDYSVGTTNTLPNPILPLYSRVTGTNVTNLNVGGDWTTASNWTTDTDGDVNGDNPSSIVPIGVPAVILSNARINTASNGRRVFKLTINGLLSNGTTTGHNFGTIEGTGTFRTATNTFPAGNYTTFVSAAGGTVEYIAPMTMNSMTTYNNLSIYSGSTGIVTKTASNLTINGDVTIPAGTTLDNSVNNASVTIAGDWNNNGTVIHGSGTAGITFNGSATQTITGTNTFNNFTVNNTGNVILSGTTTVVGTLTLTSGNIISNTHPSVPLFVLGPSATLSGGSASSFVSGQIRKTMNSGTTFTFPTGSSAASRYRPVGILNTSATDVWDVSYIAANPATNGFPNTSFNNANLAEVSEHEYWQVANGTGTTTAGLTLSFSTGSYATGGNAGLLSSLRTARWNGTQWDLPPGGGTYSQTGNNLTGTVSVSLQSSFSPQTLASLDINSALPIELISFSGEVVQDVVRLNWETASELNNDFFTVERSAGGEVFSSVGKVNGAGTSNHGNKYSLIDHNPIYGTGYYRLKQTDFDGTVTYSKIIHVTFEGSTTPTVNVYPNPSAGDELNIKISGLQDMESVEVVMYDQLGREFMKLVLNVDKNSGTAHKTFTPEKPFPQGMYLLKAGTLTKRFVVNSK